jgi:hypothetical protein
MSVSEFPFKTEFEIDVEKGLVAYWKFDEGEGDIAFDNSGNYNDAGLMCAGEGCSPPKWVEGKIGMALEFDGVDDYVEVPNSPSLNFGSLTDFTIVTWVKRIDGAGTIVDKRNPHYVGYSLQWDGLGKVVLALRDSDGTEVVHTSIVSIGAAWCHVAVVFDRDNNATVYVNGILDSNKNINEVGNIDNTYPLRIGRRNDNASQANGLIDEVRIYDRALTEEEIKFLSKGR